MKSSKLLKKIRKALIYLYEEYPQSVSIDKLNSYFNNMDFKEILDYLKRKKYIEIKNEEIFITKIGIKYLYELTDYEHKNKYINTQTITVTISVVSIIISLLTSYFVYLPSPAKIYSSKNDICPNSIYLGSGTFFSIHLSNYGETPSVVNLYGKGVGIGIKETTNIEGVDSISYRKAGFNESYYSNLGSLIPIQKGGGLYGGTFGVVILNNSIEKPSFSFTYFYNSKLLKIIPYNQEAIIPPCCYNYSAEESKYELINC